MNVRGIKKSFYVNGRRKSTGLAIPPPALPGSGSRVESWRLSSQPGITRLPVRYILLLAPVIRNGILK